MVTDKSKKNVEFLISFVIDGKKKSASFDVCCTQTQIDGFTSVNTRSTPNGTWIRIETPTKHKDMTFHNNYTVQQSISQKNNKVFIYVKLTSVITESNHNLQTES